ncbi:MAG TPA: DNA polymerase III subunit delta [Solirubrobacterales bacterium]|nr:DNA polymerase III subunit delta [Solirubrobacterales bacterium]
MAGKGEIAPAYLIAGTDAAKIDAALARLRSRAQADAAGGALEVFAPPPGSSAGPDPAALLAAVPTLSLTANRRYLVADGVERWSAKQAAPVAEALATLPPDVTVVLVAREQPPRLRAPKALAETIEAAGGQVLSYAAPKARDLPRWLVEEAGRRGFELDVDAARLLVERLGEGTVRLATELDRLAIWAEPGGRVTGPDLEAMVADTSEEVAWALSDGIVERDPAKALAAAERLAEQGEGVTALIYQAAKRLREANAALELLAAGRSQKEVEAALPMHPYAAKMLLRRLGDRSPTELRAATCAVADLEWWTRGGADYPERVALTLAVRRAAGA